MGVGIPGFKFQLLANRLGAGLTFLESKEVQPAQQGLRSETLLGAEAALLGRLRPGRCQGH